MRQFLESETIELELDNQVVFLGQLNQRELDNFYRGIDIYIHSTRGESFGMAILEAASYALPVVASRVEGVVVEMPSNCVQLFTLGDQDDLGEKIERLSDEQSAREMGRAAREFVLTHYNSEQVAEQYLQIIASVLK